MLQFDIFGDINSFHFQNLLFLKFQILLLLPALPHFSLLSYRCATVLDQSVLVARGEFPQRKEKLSGTIDLWWVVHDGGMMLLLAHLIQQHKTWRKCRLRIFTVAQVTFLSTSMSHPLERFVGSTFLVPYLIFILALNLKFVACLDMYL